MKSKHIFFPILSGLLYGFSFPPFNIFPFSWFWLLPLLLIPLDKLRINFRRGFSSGFVAHLIILFWIWKTFRSAGIHFAPTLMCWILLSAILAIYCGLFLFVFGLLPNNGFKPWTAGALWVVFETLRSSLFSGFPWALLAHSQVKDLPLLQLASLTGAEGLSFIIIAFNVYLGTLFFKIHQPPRKNKRGKNKAQKSFILSIKINAVLISALLLTLHLWGWVRIRHSDRVQIKSLKIAILQGNIDQYQKWDSDYESMIRNRYEALVKDASLKSPDLYVWPESAVPGWYPNEPFYDVWVRSLVRKTRSNHIIGAVTSKDKMEYNAAFLVGPKGEMVSSYYKQHLVPFGEYIPFGSFLKNWVPYLGELGTFSSGKEPALFSLDSIQMAPNICYEAIFPELVRRSGNNQNHEKGKMLKGGKEKP